MTAQDMTFNGTRSGSNKGYFRTLFLIVFSVVTIYPIFWLATVALKDNRQFVQNPLGLPLHPTLESFRALLTDPAMLRYGFNSILVSVVSVLALMVFSSLAGYALARMDFRGKNIILMIYLTTQWIPLVTLIIPLLVTVQLYKIYGTYASLILPYIASGLGLATFMVRGFFRSIPHELLDSARLDGCNELQAFYKVMLPQIQSGLAVVAIIMFINNWNEYFIALTLVNREAMYTLPVGISTLSSMFGTDWPRLGAALFLSTLPTLLLYIFFSDVFMNSASRSVGFGGR
ncbi:MAG: carbohydrate ABC transporter permease [Chloroflexi bacterium]|nr:carbohydrate ABC transporter permease [Chloroflexota bacterium]